MNATQANAIQKCLPILLALARAILSYEKSVKAEKHLSKEEAKQILEVEGYENVVIGAVVHGAVGLLGGDNAAFVIAMGTHPDIYHYSSNGEIQRTFAFDEQLGWFTWIYIGDAKTGKSKLYICTQNGKQTITN